MADQREATRTRTAPAVSEATREARGPSASPNGERSEPSGAENQERRPSRSVAREPAPLVAGRRLAVFRLLVAIRLLVVVLERDPVELGGPLLAAPPTDLLGSAPLAALGVDELARLVALLVPYVVSAAADSCSTAGLPPGLLTASLRIGVAPLVGGWPGRLLLSSLSLAVLWAALLVIRAASCRVLPAPTALLAAASLGPLVASLPVELALLDWLLALRGVSARDTLAARLAPWARVGRRSVSSRSTWLLPA
ncbi:hypothetical protein HALDL1_02735 [Halobacterium sp. DL1]|nr:hypothetical protein HALDL1_02735 [Halobacterium sp. DL1]